MPQHDMTTRLDQMKSLSGAARGIDLHAIGDGSGRSTCSWAHAQVAPAGHMPCGAWGLTAATLFKSCVRTLFGASSGLELGPRAQGHIELTPWARRSATGWPRKCLGAVIVMHLALPTKPLQCVKLSCLPAHPKLSHGYATINWSCQHLFSHCS